MTLKEKMALIEEIMDVEENVLSPETQLDSIEEWDSVAVLTLIAMLDEKFGKQVSGQEIKKLKTVGDILNYIQ